MLYNIKKMAKKYLSGSFNKEVFFHSLLSIEMCKRFQQKIVIFLSLGFTIEKQNSMKFSKRISKQNLHTIYSQNTDKKYQIDILKHSSLNPCFVLTF